MASVASKRILLAPLDWGMGHTTRCAPLLRYLLDNGHEPVFAGNEWQRQYINKTIPAIRTIHLPGYDVHYGKEGANLLLSLAAQMPRILKKVKEEHSWLQQLTTKEHFDGVISDNRYGLYHNSVSSVVMTHQLQIQTGMGSIADNILRRLHYRMLGHFDKCWVVDVAEPPGLSGILAHPGSLPQGAEYIGLLSQLQPQHTSEEHLLILLSGPEPHRSILSGILWEQVQHYRGKVVFVEGADKVQGRVLPGHIDYYGRITAEVLQPLIAAASVVICRSGYSSLMDLVQLQKKAIVIPTPGQTEQEYLGKHMHAMGLFYCTDQKRININNILADKNLLQHSYFPFRHSVNQFRQYLDNWLSTL